ncbi:hypothetical protein [Microvirga sp. 2TAF3]|uniref:hypothetical protein n=1 Tax=Microvirga sp. 2TAF3 TaxID=3233014 RepID=UPI003F95B631
MPDPKRLVSFLVSPVVNGGDPELIVELDDGSRVTLTATFEQIEDMADALDDILDTTMPAVVEDAPDQTTPPL